ncbi:MAG TPA: CarD family transcriptional regulator [Candidatus Aminicenantes bacterium]|nr:CarD family transcriptional regulator [Candidatus Aminicenantes bacterium]HRY64201.1 CarD family transcriptional regulator [Candidatus Aminicenantes bacterium]HRZ71114.1 CarD family transcriptional regulator [Candidatus Aminicenantes bacterium]
MKTLKIGDKVIYPNQGLGVVEAIREEAYNGESFRVLNLRIISNNTLVTVPSSTALELGIRRPVAEESIRKVFQFMGDGDVDVTTDWKGRYKEHINLMRSGTLLDMATVLKSLYYLSTQKPLSFREKKMMEKAKELIVSEISEAVDTPSAKIEEKLLDTLSRSFKTAKSRIAA